MAAYTTLRSTFGRLPDNVDDDRFVDAWAELVADAIENAASRGTRDDRRDRASRSRRWLLAQPGTAGPRQAWNLRPAAAARGIDPA